MSTEDLCSNTIVICQLCAGTGTESHPSLEAGGRRRKKAEEGRKRAASNAAWWRHDSLQCSIAYMEKDICFLPQQGLSKNNFTQESA